MKIILAEDEPVTRRLLEQTLSSEGHQVAVAGDGEAAWQLFVKDPAPLLILDWQMPVVDGLELCRRIRAGEGGDTPFILMLTGRDASDDVVSAIDAGVDDYIVKPVSPQHLRVRVNIAERRIAADSARRVAEQQLEEARWRAGAGEAILALQHEINNPLAALLATLELATDAVATLDEKHAALDTSLTQTRRIASVMRRMSSMKAHRSVEYLPGVKMLELPAAD